MGPLKMSFPFPVVLWFSWEYFTLVFKPSGLGRAGFISPEKDLRLSLPDVELETFIPQGK